jgi:hypothetical protein
MLKYLVETLNKFFSHYSLTLWGWGVAKRVNYRRSSINEVFGVAESESDLRIKKFKMANMWNRRDRK